MASPLWRDRPASSQPTNEPMPASAKRAAAKKPAGKKPAPSKPPAGLAGLPEWNLADLYAGLDDPRIARDLDRSDAESLAFEETYKGKLAALADGRAGRPGALGRRSSATRRSTISSAGSSPMRAWCMPATPSIRRAPSSTATCRTASPPPPPICCSSCSSSTGSTTPSSRPPWRIRRSPITGRGSRTSARRSRTSSRTGSSSCFTRNR